MNLYTPIFNNGSQVFRKVYARANRLFGDWTIDCGEHGIVRSRQLDSKFTLACVRRKVGHDNVIISVL